MRDRVRLTTMGLVLLGSIVSCTTNGIALVDTLRAATCTERAPTQWKAAA